MTASLDQIVAASTRHLVGRPEGTFLERAEAERIAPLLYYGLSRSGWPETIPETDRVALRRNYYRTAGKNVRLLSALAEVADALRERGIDAVRFKGAALASELYPNVALRPMGDVDILVRPVDAENAESALMERGFRPWTPDMTQGLSRRIKHARLFVRGAVNIDLHWSLVGHGGDARAPHPSWIEASTARGRLTDTAHLLYLAAHMKLQHYDEPIPLVWLVDFYLLSTRGRIDWATLSRDAAALGWGDALAACTEDVRDRLDARLPQALETLTPSTRRSTHLHREGARYGPERVWNELRTASWRARLALVRAYVLPSPEYVRFRYPASPAWTWPLGYAKRWLAIATRGVAFARRRLTRGTDAQPLLAPRENC